MMPVDNVTCASASPNPLCGRIAAAIVQCVVDCASNAACRYGSAGASVEPHPGVDLRWAHAIGIGRVGAVDDAQVTAGHADVERLGLVRAGHRRHLGGAAEHVGRTGVEQEQPGAAQRVVLGDAHLDGRERPARGAARRRAGRAGRRTRPPSRRSCTPTSRAGPASSSTRRRSPARASDRLRRRCASCRGTAGATKWLGPASSTSMSSEQVARVSPRREAVRGDRVASPPGHGSSSSMRTFSW